ncbi:MAG TPA: pseudouridine synthase, partial [Candidatus Paceibacterota bacterium]|nr:pseudouridine synthase [Candidatus Paceibacterota bacterium]
KNLKEKKLSPLGRLDKDSEGLMILSDDGRIVHRLLAPEEAHEKEYLVVVDKNIPGTHLRKMEIGINIEGYRTKPAKTARVSEKIFRITLTEGKKHQIRRMCAAAGYQVRTLKRIRIENIKIGKLKENQYREIEGKERENFLKNLLNSI